MLLFRFSNPIKQLNMSTHDTILQVLKEKSSMKQDVYARNLEVFRMLRETVIEFADTLKPQASGIDKRLIVEYRNKSEFEFELRVAGDILIFSVHTNVFEFDNSHPMWKTSYIKENAARSYCGMINIYNFLSDSFKYNRYNDLGYLVARIFVNHEGHYFVEGKRQLGFLYNDFAASTISKEDLRKILESAVLYCLDFDLFTPPYDEVKVISLAQVLETSAMMSVKTGKRLGFRYQADNDVE
jgi:hypothetical protein